MSDTAPTIVVTTTTRGSRLHLHGCKNSNSGRPVAIADFATATCCRPKTVNLHAARQALGKFADPGTIPELLAVQGVAATKPGVEAITSAETPTQKPKRRGKNEPATHNESAVAATTDHVTEAPAADTRWLDPTAVRAYPASSDSAAPAPPAPSSSPSVSPNTAAMT